MKSTKLYNLIKKYFLDVILKEQKQREEIFK